MYVVRAVKLSHAVYHGLVSLRMSSLGEWDERMYLVVATWLMSLTRNWEEDIQLPALLFGYVDCRAGASGAEFRGTSNRLAGSYTSLGQKWISITSCLCVPADVPTFPCPCVRTHVRNAMVGTVMDCALQTLVRNSVHRTACRYDVKSPESFMVLMHFINTHGVPPGEKLWECPCTSRRNINVTNGTIDGSKPIPFQCSQQLLDEGNTACSLATYQGGYRCCEHGVFLTEELPGPEAPIDQIEAKFTFEYYEKDAPATRTARPTTQPSCCDATAGYLVNTSYFANLEYDVPKCAAGTPEDHCVHVIESIEYFDALSNKSDPNEEFELVHAWGHQHVGGLGLELYRGGELLLGSVQETFPSRHSTPFS